MPRAQVAVSPAQRAAPRRASCTEAVWVSKCQMVSLYLKHSTECALTRVRLLALQPTSLKPCHTQLLGPECQPSFLNGKTALAQNYPPEWLGLTFPCDNRHVPSPLRRPGAQNRAAGARAPREGSFPPRPSLRRSLPVTPTSVPCHVAFALVFHLRVSASKSLSS